MKSLTRLFKWILRMWPILVPVLLASLHYLGFNQVSLNWEEINQIIPPVVQVIGGVLVLYSIDSNLGIANNTSLYDIFVSYLKSFPLIQRNVTLYPESITSQCTVSSPKVRAFGPTNTVDEKIDHLQQQIEWLKEDLADEIKNLNTLIQNSESRTTESLTTIGKKVKGVENKVSELTIGGLKIQIFGVLLIIYGSAVSYHA